MAKNLVVKGKATAKAEAARTEEIDDELAASPLAAVLGRECPERDDNALQKGFDYWLERLTVSGFNLAPELQGEPGLSTPPLLEAFRRGRLQVCSRGQKLQEVDDEVRSYAILLFGRCRRRCRIPGARGKPEEGDEAELAATAGIDSDGLVHCDTVYPGESLGVAPGEQKSAYDIQATQEAAVLHLSLEDYVATLRPSHREVQSRAIDFLKHHQLCPQATNSQLQRLVSVFRYRNMRRGTQIVKAGELQRRVCFLRDGCISVSRPRVEVEPPVLAEGEIEEMDSSEEERMEFERLERMRQFASGANQQNKAAAEEDKRAKLQKLSRGLAKKKFAKKQLPSFVNASGRGTQGKEIVVAHVAEPGAMLGEESLLYEQYWDLAVAKNGVSARAETDTSMYTADVSIFRHLAMCMGNEGVADGVVNKFERHGSHITSNDKSAKRLDKFARQLQKEEKKRLNRQDIRLPARGGGYRGITEIEDVDDWLTVVFKHRRHPPDEAHPPNLNCLEALELRPNFVLKGPQMAPGLKSVLKEAELQEHGLEVVRTYRNPIRTRKGQRFNPMGASVAPGVSFAGASLPHPFALEAGSDGEAVAPSGPGIFFQTEPNLEELTGISAPSRSSSVPVLPRLGVSGASPGASGAAALSLTASGAGSSGFSPAAPQDDKTFMKSQDDKTFMKSQDGKMSMKSQDNKTVLTRDSKPPLPPEGPQIETLRDKQRRVNGTNMKVARNFAREVAGRSLLVLTDKVDARKAITHATQQVEVMLTFVKSSPALWKQLRETKEHHDVLIIDLAKTDMQVEDILRTVRHHSGYERMPIVVLSADRELSEVVQQSCSFVVFRPLSAKMLREALLWCIDRRLLADKYAMPPDSVAKSGDMFSLSDGHDFMVEATPYSSTVEGFLKQSLVDRTDSPPAVPVS